MSVLAILQRFQEQLVNETNAGALSVELSARTFDQLTRESNEMMRVWQPFASLRQTLMPYEPLTVQTIAGPLQVTRERDDADPRRPAFRRSEAFR